MQIKIHTTVGEIRTLGKLPAFCKHFSYGEAGVVDNAPVVMTLEQAQAIGLPLPWDSEIVRLPTPKRKKK